jgi:hypothetical protein
MSALPRPEQAKTATMPAEHRGRLHDMERRSPAGPSLRQPRPQRPINRREAKPWMAGTIRDCQLVPKGDDLEVQCRARTNQETKRVEKRDDDGHDESSVFGTACNLNRHKAYRVLGRHNWLRAAVTWAQDTIVAAQQIPESGRLEFSQMSKRVFFATILPVAHESALGR